MELARQYKINTRHASSQTSSRRLASGTVRWTTHCEDDVGDGVGDFARFFTLTGPPLPDLGPRPPRVAPVFGLASIVQEGRERARAPTAAAQRCALDRAAAEALGPGPPVGAVALLEVKEPHLGADDGKGDAGGEEADDRDEEPAERGVPQVDEMTAQAMRALEAAEAAEADRVFDRIVYPV